MGYGLVGRLRGEAEYCGFHDMWITEAKDLTTPAFRRELRELRHALRREPFGGGFAAMEAIGKMQNPDRGNKGFKIRTENYSYYFRCTPTGMGYDVSGFVYDNSFLRPKLAGKHELPAKCFCVLPDTGELVMLQQERPYILPFESKDSPEIRRQVANELNEAMGVTKAQAAAMYMGCLYGFDDPCAWPWQYDQNGEPRCNEKKNTDKGAR